MIKEAYVSFEVAKLLKEKGFDEPTLTFYIPFEGGEVKFNIGSNEIHYNTLNEYPWIIAAPTHQMACAYLREKHNILISIIPQEVKVGVSKLCYAIYRIAGEVYIPLYNGFINNLVDSYEDAVETAIKYSLENLL
jgi:hypothetical protein